MFETLIVRQAMQIMCFTHYNIFIMFWNLRDVFGWLMMQIRFNATTARRLPPLGTYLLLNTYLMWTFLFFKSLRAELNSVTAELERPVYKPTNTWDKHEA